MKTKHKTTSYQNEYKYKHTQTEQIYMYMFLSVHTSTRAISMTSATQTTGRARTCVWCAACCTVCAARARDCCARCALGRGGEDGGCVPHRAHAGQRRRVPLQYAEIQE